MHLPTYLTLMLLGALYGIARAVHMWSANQVLFWTSVIVVVLNVANAYVQSMSGDDLEMKFMLWYLIPLSLLVLGSFAGYREIQNIALSQVGTSLPPVLPGKSTDYQSAALSHFGSMLFPLLTAAVAKLVQKVIAER